MNGILRQNLNHWRRLLDFQNLKIIVSSFLPWTETKNKADYCRLLLKQVAFVSCLNIWKEIEKIKTFRDD